jgi:hypothetical protein
MSDDPASGDGGEAEAPPRPSEARAKRKKRRARAEPVSERVPGPRTRSAQQEDDDGSAAPAGDDDRVPAFAHAFPRDAELDALVAAFEAGDYARVRREAPALAQRTEDDAVRRAARELRRRLDPDPAAVYMLLAAAMLLVFLAGWYWLHPHAP